MNHHFAQLNSLATPLLSLPSSFFHWVHFSLVIVLAKLVDVECPRCGVQSRLPFGLVDAFTHEPVTPSCSKCGFEFEYEI